MDPKLALQNRLYGERVTEARDGLLFFPEGKTQWLFSSIFLKDSNSTIDV